MEENKKTKISLSTFLLIIAIIVIAVMGFIIYKLYNEKNTETTVIGNANVSTECSPKKSEDKSVENYESKTSNTNESSLSSISQQETKPVQVDNENIPAPKKGKIYVKRNGKITLENVPTNIVGTYVNKDDSNDYFTLNSDGTFYITTGNGDSNDHDGRSVYNQNNAFYQLTYIHSNASSIDPEVDDEKVMIEFYTTSYNGWLPSPFRLGDKDSNGNYVFSVIDGTPTANIGEATYQKK